MILKIDVRSGATFTLDKELLTWQRDMDGRHTHGKMYMWPQDIAIGKSVTIFNTDAVSKIGQAFHTTAVVRIEHITRDEPDIAPSANHPTV